MDNTLYQYSPILGRPKLTWPNGKRMAFYVGLNIEHFDVDKPATSIFPNTTMLKPDPLNYSWRDYGVRVGVWRVMDALDRFGLRASVLLNSAVCKHYPQIVDAGKQRKWAWLGHGRDNSTFITDMNVDEERKFLTEVIDTIAGATGQKVNGWLGPALTETFETPRLLRELGLSYILDWCADDQPFATRIPGLISVPYGVEHNDITLFLGKSLSGDAYYQICVDQFDRLYMESAESGRVMALGLHPFIIGVPFRQKYLEKVLEYIVGHGDVWLTTSDEIAAHFLTNHMRES